MRKIIVRIDSDTITPQQALMYVAKVIEGGRVSNYGTEYCGVTRFNREDYVYAKRSRFISDTDTSDTFVVWKEKE